MAPITCTKVTQGAEWDAGTALKLLVFGGGFSTLRCTSVIGCNFALIGPQRVADLYSCAAKIPSAKCPKNITPNEFYTENNRFSNFSLDNFE